VSSRLLYLIFLQLVNLLLLLGRSSASKDVPALASSARHQEMDLSPPVGAEQAIHGGDLRHP
jgi:hypothetical protein